MENLFWTDSGASQGHTVISNSCSSLIQTCSVHVAAVKGDVASLQQIISEFPRCTGAQDYLGRNALIYAVIGNQLKCVKLLLKLGIDANQVDGFGRTALHWAALKVSSNPLLYHTLFHRFSSCLYERNHVQCAKYLLSYGGGGGGGRLRCNVQDKEGASALHLAAKHSSSECLSLILKHLSLSEIDAQDNDKRTALHWSACCAHPENVRLLVSRTNLSIGMRDVEGKTALHWAASSSGKGAADCMRILLSHENGAAVVNLHDLEGRTALHCAVIDRVVSVVHELVSLSTSNVDLMDNWNCTPLHWATILEHEEIVSLLLDRKASISIHDIDGATPLHYAAQSNSVEIVKIYMSKMCNADQNDHSCCTPLMWAASKAANDVVVLLCQYGANLCATDNHGFTALHVAALSGHSSTVRTLLAYGASVNAVDALGRTALFHACEMGHISAIRALLDGASLLSVIDHNGRSCLHWSAISGHVDVCQFLIERGCDPNASDFSGRPPLLHATFHNQIDCMSHLLESGVKPGVSDKEGWTALHWACHQGYLDAVKLLLDYSVNKNRMTNSGVRFTPLDLAIIGYHYEVADFLLKRGCVSITHIQEMAANIIQAAYRGYRVRKFCEVYRVNEQILAMRNDNVKNKTAKEKVVFAVGAKNSAGNLDDCFESIANVNCRDSYSLVVCDTNSPVRRLSCSDESLFNEAAADDMFQYLSVSCHTGAIRLNRKKFQNLSSDLALMSKDEDICSRGEKATMKTKADCSSRRRLKSSGDVFNCGPKEINSRSMLRLNDLRNFKRGFFNPFKKKANSAIDLGNDGAMNQNLEDQETPLEESPDFKCKVRTGEKLDKTVQFVDVSEPIENIPSWCYDPTLRKVAENEWLETLADITIERIPMKWMKEEAASALN